MLILLLVSTSASDINWFCELEEKKTCKLKAKAPNDDNILKLFFRNHIDRS